MRRAFLSALAAAAGLALATPAGAQSVAMPAHPDINLAGFSGDPSALPDAVAAIEAASGGRVVEIRYDNVSGAPGYDVVVAKGASVTFARFSKPAGGLTVLTSDARPRWMLDWVSRRNIDLARLAAVPLDKAIRTAEASRGGAPAVAAGIAATASQPTNEVHAYNVAVLTDGAQRRVAVDSETGMVIADPRALIAWP